MRFFIRFLTICFLLLSSASLICAQWEPERQIVVSDSSSATSPNNARCVAVWPGGFVQEAWYDTRESFGEIYTKRSNENR